MLDLDDLRAELDDFAQPAKKEGCSPREERIIAGFEEIQQFFTKNGRAPKHGEDKDIFERLYAVRLERLRAVEEYRSLLAAMDHQGLLSGVQHAVTESESTMDDDELLAELSEGGERSTSITDLRYVRSSFEKREAEEIASRDKCEDFDRFQPLLESAESELKSGVRQARPFGKEVSVIEGNFFILNGQLVYVAEVGDTIKAPNGENDARLRVIYANGTESNLLRRSLQRALYKDEAGRRLSEPDAGPLFREALDEDDIESGFIYVLRSLSTHPYIAEHRELIHKIGVTGGKVETRIANAVHDATYLLADVEVVASYQLAGINRTKLEKIFHRVFASVQLDLTINDRFGHPVRPREWFLVPLHIIDEVVQRVLDGSITDVVYNATTAQLISHG
ncbi:GIY-YIG nuclease family protein [Iodobacter ciconiae]|uniref:GIY-YIG nuclease family protein n=1 Tax=Iodobacter ciconiae TaxID=2496266 RepID=A0A3S8ZNQ5_9NEIS|nr:GIY-YIG nuclease family protein [Iodobacter ciconiae]AZN35022.1 GIY-YIG nuclease family protein [Iodobacter ciconiae]